MKKISLMLTLAIMMVGSAVFAGNIDYLSNQSAKYIMNTARTAATDGADIVAYNPAGTALMGEGFFIDVSNQTVLKYFSEEIKDAETYKQSEPTLFLPNAFAVYNFGQVGMGKLAAFASAGIVAGGGSLNWDDGTVGGFFAADFITSKIALPTDVTAVNLKIQGSSVYYGIGAGAAYSFLEDMLSVSAGVRYVLAKKTAKMKGTMDFFTSFSLVPAYGSDRSWELAIDSSYDYEATGYTGIFGFDAKPMKELTIGVRYEMETALEFEYTQKTNTVSTAEPVIAVGGLPVVLAGMLDKDGDKANRNLPQIISVGAEYVVIPELAVSVGSNVYLINKADMNGYEDYFGTAYELSLGAVYKVMEPLKVGGTFTYSNQAAKKELIESEDLFTVIDYTGNPVCDSLMFGLGATYTVMPNLDVTLAGNWVHYLPEKAYDGDVTYSKEVYTIAVGVAYKI